MNAQASEPLAEPIPDFARRCGLGRTTIYQAIAAGELQACKIGKRTLIELDEGRRWLASKRAPLGAPVARQRPAA